MFFSGVESFSSANRIRCRYVIISKRRLELLSRRAGETTGLTSSKQRTRRCSVFLPGFRVLSSVTQDCGVHMSVFCRRSEQKRQAGLLQLLSLCEAKPGPGSRSVSRKAGAGREGALLACSPCRAPLLALQQHLVACL